MTTTNAAIKKEGITSTYTQGLPALSNADYGRLRADIEERGCLIPVELDEVGAVLDGVHRMRACQELGFQAPTITRPGLTEEEKREHALTLNLNRRHLAAPERAKLHRELRKLGKSLRAIAAASGSSQSTVRRDLAGGEAPEVVIGRDGKGYAPRRPKPAPILDMPGLLTKAQQDRLGYIADRPAFGDVEPPKGSYSVILADPPWRYAVSSPEKAIERHYPTMALEDICALPVPAAKDAVLFLWATNPLLPDALEVMKAWGFSYKTNACWTKDKLGLGRYVRGQHELLLIGRRGSEARMPEPANRPSSVINAPRGAHSEKPVEVYELIERMYPNLKKRIELFARSGRKGWKSWGNQAPTP